MLLFKPWRDCETLIGASETYTDAFLAFNGESVDAVNYDTCLQQHQDKHNTVRMQIDRCCTDMEIEEQNPRKEVQAIDPLLHVISEAQEAMADFQVTLVDNDDVDVDAMIKNLNEDQLRIFDTDRNYMYTCNACHHKLRMHNFLHMFSSGGTGKGYLIKTIKHGFVEQLRNMLQLLLQQELLHLT